MAARVNIEISDNAAWTKTFSFTTAAGVAVDLTGSTFEMDVRENADDAAPVATLSSALASIALSATPTDGTIRLSISAGLIPAGAAGVPARYVHDLRRTVSGATEILWQGTLIVRKGVTRDD